MYTVNQDDVHPVLGPSNSAENLYLCHGESGHGFKLAPAVGSLMAQSILDGSRVQDDTFETNIPVEVRLYDERLTEATSWQIVFAVRVPTLFLAHFTHRS